MIDAATPPGRLHAAATAVVDRLRSDGADFVTGLASAEAAAGLGDLAAAVLALTDRLSGVALGPEPLAKRAW